MALGKFVHTSDAITETSVFEDFTPDALCKASGVVVFPDVFDVRQKCPTHKPF